MKRMILMMLLLLATPAYGQGVVLQGEQRDRVEETGTNVVHGDTDTISQLVQIPQDEKRWQILVFSSENCPPCKQLEADLKNNSKLATLCEWGDLLIYKQENKSQAFRFRDYEVVSTPTIVITTPPTDKTFHYSQVAKYVGYDGQADKLAETMLADITLAMSKCCKATPAEPAPQALRDKLPSFTPSKLQPAITTIHLVQWLSDHRRAITTVIVLVLVMGVLLLIRRKNLSNISTTKPTPASTSPVQQAVEAYLASQQAIASLTEQMKKDLEVLNQIKTPGE